jgi:hypothetical protein
MFHRLCEEIFANWKNDRLLLTLAVRQAFDLQYCPEPYLQFGGQRAPITFVTMNLGRGEPFQQLNNIGTTRSPIRADATYQETAADLGCWYVSPSCPITPAAKTRIRAMLDLAASLGRTGVEQVECMPFHSAHAVDGHRIDQDPLLSRYSSAVSDYVASRDLVCTMVGGLADGSSVRRMAMLIGLDRSRRGHLGLTVKNGRCTSGIVFGRNGGRIRAVFYRQGNLGMPGKATLAEHLPRIRDVLL